MKLVQDIEDLKNKKILLRADFNVSVKNGDVKEKFKIEAAKKTVEFLLEKGAKVGLLSHLGRPEGKVNPEFSLEQIRDDVAQILGVKVSFVSDCVGERVGTEIENLSEGVLLLENVRFYEGDEKNDEIFSGQLAQNFDFFINDAFSVSHRNQASVTGVTKILPSFAGFNLQKEIEVLDKVKNDFARPAVAVIGGAKIETKLPVIKFFEEKYDYILVGGKVANEAIDSGEKFSEKVFLPTDFVDDRLDIGNETIEKFLGIIGQAKTIVWNGPMGKFEEEKYSSGTEKIYEAIINNQQAFKVTGGGETLEILEERGAFDKFTFVSTGGGAMLEYLSKGQLPGLEALA